MTDTVRRRLGATGQIDVSDDAAHVARRQLEAGTTLEAARHQLATWLAEATPVDEWANPELWRFRRGSVGVDISARVRREGGRVVVVAVTIRGYVGFRTRQRRKGK